MAGLQLPKGASLDELQQYVAELVRLRGFENTVQNLIVLLIEEVGELAKASRTLVGLKLADDAARQNFAHESADILIVLLGLCNEMGVSLEQALREKEAINTQRKWK